MIACVQKPFLTVRPAFLKYSTALGLTCIASQAAFPALPASANVDDPR